MIILSDEFIDVAIAQIVTFSPSVGYYWYSGSQLYLGLSKLTPREHENLRLQVPDGATSQKSQTEQENMQMFVCVHMSLIQ
jgi:hypothetical protein